MRKALDVVGVALQKLSKTLDELRAFDSRSVQFPSFFSDPALGAALNVLGKFVSGVQHSILVELNGLAILLQLLARTHQLCARLAFHIDMLPQLRLEAFQFDPDGGEIRTQRVP